MYSKKKTHKKHILIVDDDLQIRSLVENSLNLLNPEYHITTAPNGSIALEQFKRDPVDLILTDYQMPEMSGLELISAVRAISSEASIILMTGNGSQSLRKRVKEMGLQGYMEKPFSLTALQKNVQGLLCSTK